MPEYGVKQAEHWCDYCPDNKCPRISNDNLSLVFDYLSCKLFTRFVCPWYMYPCMLCIKYVVIVMKNHLFLSKLKCVGFVKNVVITLGTFAKKSVTLNSGQDKL